MTVLVGSVCDTLFFPPSQVQTTRDKLEAAFAQTLRGAVDAEQKRLATELDAAAASALAEVGGLRILLSQQNKELLRLGQAAEDAHRERDVLVRATAINMCVFLVGNAMC